MSSIIPAWMALTAGLYFAACQVGFFIHLEFNLSSTFVSYYAMLGTWILGSLGGLCLRRPGLGPALLAGGVVAYYAHGWLVVRFPYDMRWLPVYVLCVCITSLYSGYFFRQAREQFGSARSLFFHENNGFLIGYLVAGIELLLYGQVTQQILPAGLASVHLLSLALAKRCRKPDHERAAPAQK